MLYTDNIYIYVVIGEMVLIAENSANHHFFFLFWNLKLLPVCTGLHLKLLFNLSTTPSIQQSIFVLIITLFKPRSLTFWCLLNHEKNKQTTHFLLQARRWRRISQEAPPNPRPRSHSCSHRRALTVSQPVPRQQALRSPGTVPAGSGPGSGGP